MKHMLRFCSMLALVLAVPASAATRTYFGFQIGITNAPPPPRVRFYEEPDLMFLPDSRVYVVENDLGCDVFRYDRNWFLTSGGYWYRASSYRGPYQVCDVRYIPRPIFTVPANHWRYRDDRWSQSRGRGNGWYQQRLRDRQRAWDRYNDRGRGRQGDDRWNDGQGRAGNRDDRWNQDPRPRYRDDRRDAGDRSRGRSGDRTRVWNRGRDTDPGDDRGRQWQRNDDGRERGRGQGKDGKSTNRGYQDSD